MLHETNMQVALRSGVRRKISTDRTKVRTALTNLNKYLGFGGEREEGSPAASPSASYALLLQSVQPAALPERLRVRCSRESGAVVREGEGAPAKGRGTGGRERDAGTGGGRGGEGEK